MFHFHDFIPVAVQRMTKQSPADALVGNSEDLKQGIGINLTNVLKRCECGKVTTELVKGWWTLEEIKGEPKKNG